MQMCIKLNDIFLYMCNKYRENSKWDPSLQVAINKIITDNLPKNDKRKQINIYNSAEIIYSTPPCKDVYICGKEVGVRNYSSTQSRQCRSKQLPLSIGFTKVERTDVQGHIQSQNHQELPQMKGFNITSAQASSPHDLW